MNRRQFLAGSLVSGISSSIILPPRSMAVEDRNTSPAVDYRLTQQTPARRFDGKESFCHPRAGIVPGVGKDGGPRVVMTMLTIDLSGSDVFKEMYGLTTDDLGRTWTEPAGRAGALPPQRNDRRRRAARGVQRFLADVAQAIENTLRHRAHGRVHTRVEGRGRSSARYGVCDVRCNKRAWRAWRKMAMPDDPQFAFAGAGCTQRVDLADGTILLPIYYRISLKNTTKRVLVTHCSFDGQIAEAGHDLGKPIIEEDGTRGVGEPSLTKFDDMYYLTIRHPLRAYVTRSKDGLDFEPIRPWTFDDGTEFGNYETQTHWVTHSDGLFLVYNRRGLNNDHVFRHRAPLLMAQVDPERLCVLRKTERELVPNRGARLGNFGVTDVSPTRPGSRSPSGCSRRASKNTAATAPCGSPASIGIGRIGISKYAANPRAQLRQAL